MTAPVSSACSLFFPCSLLLCVAAKEKNKLSEEHAKKEKPQEELKRETDRERERKGKENRGRHRREGGREGAKGYMFCFG